MAFCAALLLAAGSALAQYKVIGPDGKITYTDRPPSADQGRVQTLSLGAGNGVELASLPPELRQPASRFPVTLYAAVNCAPCDTGRSLLLQRGIPFQERRVESAEDIAALNRLTGGRTLPVLAVGSQQIKSLSSTEWTSYLDAAGYPASSKLPANYRPPSPTPLAPPAAAPAPAAIPEAGAPAASAAAPARKGPDIRF